MANLSIDMKDFEDARMDPVTSQTFFTTVPQKAREALDAGGKVVIERRYTNARPDVLHEFDTREQFHNFWNTFFKK